MAAERSGDEGDIDAAIASSNTIGKRYTDAGGAVELLCIKVGTGALSFDGVELRSKDAKLLSSSD